MPIKIGNTSFKDIYVGSTAIQKAYIGNTLFYTKGGEPVFPLNGLQSYYRMDETTGTIAHDAVGGINGTVAGGALNAVGKIGRCWRSAVQKNAGVNIGNVYNLTATTPYTFSAWIRCEGYSVAAALIYSKQATFVPSAGHYLATNSSRNLYTEIQSNSNSNNTIRVNTANGVFNLNQWHYVTMTYDGSGQASGVKFYVDGVSLVTTVTKNTLSGNDCTNSEPFRIGAYMQTQSGFGFAGSIDEVGIWNRALAPEEIQALYNNGNGLALQQ